MWSASIYLSRLSVVAGRISRKNAVVLPIVYLILTALTGIIDAVSYLSLGHVFTANMTGNAVFLAFALAGAKGLSAARSGTALAGFMAGAALGGRIAIHLKVDVRRWIAAILFVQATLLVLAATVAAGFDLGPAHGQVPLYAVIALTAVAMGVQNATVLELAVPGFAPNVLTSAVTRIAGTSWLLPGHDPLWTRHLASVASMLGGAMFGAWLSNVSAPWPWPLALCAALTAACGMAVSSDESLNSNRTLG
jgi:uncharacterized membrane protein YoaK (UPF0700 family)